MDEDDLPPNNADGIASGDADSGAGYEVGYRKPPRHSQFKPGNRRGKGRPRGTPNLKTCVKEAMETKVRVKVDGKVQNRTILEVSIQRLAHKAAGGDLKAIDKALSLVERYCPPEDEGSIPDEDTAYDLETLRHLLSMRHANDDS